MQAEKPTGKQAFENMDPKEREIRIELQMQLNRIKGRSFSKEQINEEVALRLAGKPGKLLLSEGLGDTLPLARESVASIQAREETLQKVAALEDRVNQLAVALEMLPVAIEKGLETLRAELQVDLQGQADSEVTQVSMLLQRITVDLKSAATKQNEAKADEKGKEKPGS